MGLPSVETAVGEYLQPGVFIFDVRQRGQVFLRNGWSISAPKDSLNNLAFDREAADKTHRRAALAEVEGVLAEPEALREGPGNINEIRIHALGGGIHETASEGTSRGKPKEEYSVPAG